MSGKPSLIVFGPQSKKLSEPVLSELRLLLHQESSLRPLLNTVTQLPELWPVFAENDSRV